MSIQVVCPNGHTLTVKDALAGKSGLCPKCKARVMVPELSDGGLSEDLIMNILGPSQPAPGAPATLPPDPDPFGSEALEGEKSSPPKKACHKCNRLISTETHICPYCHTYIAELSDF